MASIFPSTIDAGHLARWISSARLYGMKMGKTIRFECLEPFTFVDGVRLAWVTWEITSDGWGFTKRQAVAVREASS